MTDTSKHAKIKTFIFDDLLEFLEETGEASAITADEIASLIDATEQEVSACFQDMVNEGVLDLFEEDGVTYASFSSDTQARLIKEMTDAGWIAPEDEDADVWEDDDDGDMPF